VAFADRFGATVELTTTAADVGYFLVQRRAAVDHAQFRAIVAAAVGGLERIQFESPGGLLVVVTQYSTAQTLRMHPMVDHVGGITVDPERLPTLDVVVSDETDGGS
jgi:hypothetical protein